MVSPARTAVFRSAPLTHTDVSGGADGKAERERRWTEEDGRTALELPLSNRTRGFRQIESGGIAAGRAC